MVCVPRLSQKTCMMDRALVQRFGHHNGWPEPERKQQPENSTPQAYAHAGILEGGEPLPQLIWAFMFASLDRPPYVSAGRLATLFVRGEGFGETDSGVFARLATLCLSRHGFVRPTPEFSLDWPPYVSSGHGFVRPTPEF